MRELRNTKIIAVDHGYGNMKTANIPQRATAAILFFLKNIKTPFCLLENDSENETS